MFICMQMRILRKIHLIQEEMEVRLERESEKRRNWVRKKEKKVARSGVRTHECEHRRS